MWSESDQFFKNATTTIILVFDALVAISLWNSLEVIFVIFFTFKKFHGAYFWSLLIAAIGIIISTIGQLLLFFKTPPINWVYLSLAIVGWCLYIVCQSLVLWSRLHLVLTNKKVRRGVLWMIITTAIIFLIPTSVLAYGSSSATAPEAFTNGINIMEPIQVTGFSIQEFIISAIYIRETARLARIIIHRQSQVILLQLLFINSAFVLMDCCLIALQYRHKRVAQVMVKTLVYSIKIKLELAVLRKMVDFAGGRNALPTDEDRGLPTSL